MQTADTEIQAGVRFSFGKNWSSFLKTLDDSRIEIAVQSLRDLLQVESLAGKTFLDIGSGSGLFSLAARRLGAKVTSFDFDPASVTCAEQLRSRFEPDQNQWSIQLGSALNATFLESLGKFDVVYSWGVLHHTGDLKTGLELARQRVRQGGLLVLALYNDQGWQSQAWRLVKQIYCANYIGRSAVKAVFYPYFGIRTGLLSLVRGRDEFSHYRKNRGMSITHDWDDWLGGLPFEVVKFESVVSEFQLLGFNLIRSKRTRRLGCHEFVFQAAGHHSA